LLQRIEKGAERYRNAMRNGLRNSRINLGQGEENIHQYVEDLQVSAKRLRERYDGQRSISADVEEVLRRAAYVDRFMQRHPLVTRADREWTALRQELDRLAQAYNVAWLAPGEVSRPMRLNDRELRALLERIKRGSDQFRNSLNKALKNDRTIDRQSRDNINQTLKDFSGAVERAKNKTNDQAFVSQAEELLRWASTIDRFMSTHRLGGPAQSDWASVRGGLDELARAYNLAW
jgi:hypothetical protein